MVSMESRVSTHVKMSACRANAWFLEKKEDVFILGLYFVSGLIITYVLNVSIEEIIERKGLSSNIYSSIAYLEQLKYDFH